MKSSMVSEPIGFWSSAGSAVNSVGRPSGGGRGREIADLAVAQPFDAGDPGRQPGHPLELVVEAQPGHRGVERSGRSGGRRFGRVGRRWRRGR
jgi:hypothetical protein